MIAAGAHSKALAAQAGDRVPLETERGYHIEFDMETPPVSRPVRPSARGFYLVPMAGRLRVAGTVELGGPVRARQSAPSGAPGARRWGDLSKLGEPNRSWLGFRPSMPNSVPVVRPSRGGRNVILAFGHGHLGLTLAPVTARMVSQMIASNALDMERPAQ